MIKKEILIFGVSILVIVLVITFFLNKGSVEEIQVIPKDSEVPTTSNIFESEWASAVLTDVNTGKNFKINDFSNKPILLESFAVWCPTCTTQQKKIKELHDEIGDAFISISFDTDPNEDEEKVRQHTERNGFTWMYVVSPIDVTQALIKEFGIGFVNAPSAPVALICPDGTSKKLRNGVKSANELKTEIESCNG